MTGDVLNREVRMKVLDDKFISNKASYLFQCTLGTISVFIVLIVLDALVDAAVISTLGASSFIAFTMPWSPASRPRFLLGG